MNEPLNIPNALPIPAGNCDTLSSRIAMAIEADILASGWPVGESLGNEKQLTERFGASRWVIREALAITERDGLTVIRRGRNGGIFVSAPAEHVVVTTVRNYLLFSGVTSADLLTMRRVVEGLACRLALANRNEKQIAAAVAFRKQLEGEDDLGSMRISTVLFRQIVSLSGNRLLEILAQVLSQLSFGVGICLGSKTMSAETTNHMTRKMGRNRGAQLDAILSGNAATAFYHMHAALDDLDNLFCDSPSRGEHYIFGESMACTRRIAEQIINAFTPTREARLVDQLVLRIQLDMLRLDLAPHASLAPEKILMERYQVGRNVLREAIRILQRDKFVVATEGRQGGLSVGVPSPDHILRSNLLLFQFMALTENEVRPIARELFVYGCEKAARSKLFGGQNPTDKASAIAAAFKPASTGLKLTVENFLEFISGTTRDPILDYFIALILGLDYCEHPAPTATEQKKQEPMVEALKRNLCAGDVLMARRYASLLTERQK